MTIGLNDYITLSVILFALGFLGVLLRKNTLVIYTSDNGPVLD
jgi:NADH-quinone oxidoreductase subunit K